MSHHLSSKEIDEVLPSVDRAIHKMTGASDASLLKAAEKCLASGYDKRRMSEKLASYVDSRRAAKLAEKIFDLVEDVRTALHRSKKRPQDDKESKRAKREDEEPKRARQDSDGGRLTAMQIDAMMANAQKEIKERKRTLDMLKASNGSDPAPAPAPASQTSSLPPSSIYGIPMGLLNRGDADKARKIVQLQAQIKNKLSSGILASSPTFSSAVASATAAASAAAAAAVPLTAVGSGAAGGGLDKPSPLILDEEGRTVDRSGKAIQLTHIAPTLKANIRAKKREQFKAQLNDKVAEDVTEARFFDHRLSVKPPVRSKRALRFHEPGKFQQLADRLRMKAQLEKLQNEISQIAKKTGISSATKLALIAKPEGRTDDIPQMEWWDSVILVDTLDTLMEDGRIAVKQAAINTLVEHPTQMRPPTEPLRPVYMPVFLTKKERKKLRRQNRRETWKEEQEKIRLGLEAPPEPKLRISNLMRVLGAEAVQDPTKVEAHVREQMARRQRAHEEANAARRLTPDQRRDKRARKMREDTSLGVHVAVFRVRDLHDSAAKKFKVEANAKQMLLTGCVMLYPDCCVVVVEGGLKQLRKYKRLLLTRIKWEEDLVKDPDGKEVPNKCVLVWEGTSKQRNFGEVKFKVCPTEKMAREHFKKHKVEHYWDLAYSTAVLEPSTDETTGG